MKVSNSGCISAPNEAFQSELLLALIRTVKSECFATLNAIVTGAGVDLPLFIGVSEYG